MFIYWISYNIGVYNPELSIDNIEDIITNTFKVQSVLATTRDLKYLKTPPVVKRYGFTREGCTAYFRDDNPGSLVGGYDDIRRVCRENNHNTGVWIKTTRQITEKEARKHLELSEIFGPIKYEYKNKPKNKPKNNKLLYISIIFVLIIIYQCYKN